MAPETITETPSTVRQCRYTINSPKRPRINRFNFNWSLQLVTVSLRSVGIYCNFQPDSEIHALCSPLAARMLATSRRTNVTKERGIQSQERAYRKCNDTMFP